MIEKIKEHEDVPIYVYLREDVIPEEAILLMVFYNGMTDAFDALISYLNDATESYLSGTIITVIEDDPLDDEVDVSECCHSEDVTGHAAPLRSSQQSSPDDPIVVCGVCERECEIITMTRRELEDENQ